MAQSDQAASLAAFEQRLTAIEWRLKVDEMPDYFCRELYSFSTDGTLIIASGEEVLVSNWRARTVPESDAIVLRLSTKSSNGRADCQGNVTPLNDLESIRYVNDLQDGRLALCWRQSRESCFATLIPLDAELNI